MRGQERLMEQSIDDIQLKKSGDDFMGCLKIMNEFKEVDQILDSIINLNI